MDLNEIIEMANDAELCHSIWIDDPEDEIVQSVIKFAKLVAAKEREACAKECEHTALRMGSEWMAQHCAEAIRARGEA